MQDSLNRFGNEFDFVGELGKAGIIHKLNIFKNKKYVGQ